MKASELFAISQNSKCQGNRECYWCAAPCDETHTHDEPMPRVILTKIIPAARPASPWICKGCFLFRRPSVSVFNLDKKWVKDRQTASKWSWLITEDECLAITRDTKETFQSFLLSPPARFTLMLLHKPNMENRLHDAFANDLLTVLEGTEMKFTVDNVPHTWTVANLKHAIINGPEGVEGGARFLLENFGPWTQPKEGEEPKKQGKRKLEDGKSLLKPVGKQG